MAGFPAPTGFGPPAGSAPEARHRSERKLALAIVLIVLATFGVVGYFVYNDILKPNNAAIQAAAAASDKSGASSAVDGIQITCTSTSTDTTGLPYSATVYLKFGVSNPSSYPMDST